MGGVHDEILRGGRGTEAVGNVDFRTLTRYKHCCWNGFTADLLRRLNLREVAKEIGTKDRFDQIFGGCCDKIFAAETKRAQQARCTAVVSPDLAPRNCTTYRRPTCGAPAIWPAAGEIVVPIEKTSYF